MASVAVVTGGSKQCTKFWKDVEWNEETWMYIDLTKVLKKHPADSVGHHEDSRFELTCQVVMSQDGYADVVMRSLAEATDEGKNLFFSCNSGWHRSDTTGKTVVSYLNSFTDKNGRRQFNAMHFPLHDLRGGNKGWERCLNNIDKWCSEAWTLVDMTGYTKSSLFGYDACKGTPESSRAWMSLWERVTAARYVNPTSAHASPATPVVAPYDDRQAF